MSNCYDYDFNDDFDYDFDYDFDDNPNIKIDTSIKAIGQLVGCLWHDPLSPVYLISKKMAGKNDEVEFQEVSFRDKKGLIVPNPVLYNAYSPDTALQRVLQKSWTRKEWLMTHPNEEIPERLLDPSSQLDHPDQLYPVPKEDVDIGGKILEKFKYPYLMAKKKMHLDRLPVPGGFSLFVFQENFVLDYKRLSAEEKDDIQNLLDQIVRLYRPFTTSLHTARSEYEGIGRDSVWRGLLQYRWIMSFRDRLQESFLKKMKKENSDQKKRHLWRKVSFVIPPPDLFASLYLSYQNFIRSTKPSVIVHPFRYIESVLRVSSQNGIDIPSSELTTAEFLKSLIPSLEGVIGRESFIQPLQERLRFSSKETYVFKNFRPIEADILTDECVPLYPRTAREKMEWNKWITDDHCKQRFEKEKPSGAVSREAHTEPVGQRPLAKSAAKNPAKSSKSTQISCVYNLSTGTGQSLADWEMPLGYGLYPLGNLPPIQTNPPAPKGLMYLPSFGIPGATNPAINFTFGGTSSNTLTDTAPPSKRQKRSVIDLEDESSSLEVRVRGCTSFYAGPT